MKIRFSDLTTMRVGGEVGRLEVASTTDQLVNLLSEMSSSKTPFLIIGGGSNLIVGDEGWKDAVIKTASTEIRIDGDQVTAAAGVEWDTLVQLCLREGLAGLECLSGIPGSTGGTPVQNVGAYGSLISNVLDSVLVYDSWMKRLERWTVDQCGFGSHRQSIFKHSNRWVVIEVTFRLRRSKQSDRITYSALADRLGLAIGGTASTSDTRDAVLSLRRERGMVLDAANHDTWSVGSFFINPVVREVPDPARDCPQYLDPEGVKLAAAWLIQNSGFPPGYGGEWGRGSVRLSSRHSLAITNQGSATTAEVMSFAAHIRNKVLERFAVRLGPECTLVNCSF